MNTSKVILIRGLPGSGKSTIATALTMHSNYNHIEADNYFYIASGGERYEFNEAKLSDAHKWCFTEFKYILDTEADVIVSNTFSRIWELKPYLNECKLRGIYPQIIECIGDFGSIHNVPEEVITRMANRWESFK